MTETEQKRLEHAKRQYLLKINDTPVAILVDDDGNDVVAGCFEATTSGRLDFSKDIPIRLNPIKDERVLGYAHFMLAGILEHLKLTKEI